MKVSTEKGLEALAQAIIDHIQSRKANRTNKSDGSWALNKQNESIQLFDHLQLMVQNIWQIIARIIRSAKSGSARGRKVTCKFLT